mmetsp:Transcript_26801/g.77450  ORF Transcript_26801/g.77450 Transcript_26801/m.77450 type:complete len:189 (+) Transcript_26801:94-660(+)
MASSSAVALVLALAIATLAGAANIHAAVRSDLPEEIAAALKAGEDINKIGPGGQTPLMHAVLGGNLESVKFLLGLGADTTIGEKDGYTPLHGAGFQGRHEIAKVLLKHGLDPNERHSDGFTPMHRACWGGEERHTETVRVFLKHGVPVDQPGPNGQLPVDMVRSNEGTRKLLKHRMSKAGKADHGGDL